MKMVRVVGVVQDEVKFGELRFQVLEIDEVWGEVR